MEKRKFGTSGLVVLFSLIVVAGVFTITPQAISADKKIVWNFSLWGGPRTATSQVHTWAEEMEKKTEGRWKIKLHYGAVLAPPKEQLEGLKAGLFQACCIFTQLHPGKLPLHTVPDLPFISPEKFIDSTQLLIELWKHPALRKELLKWNAVPLLPHANPPYVIISNKPVRTVADLNGLRIRVGGEFGSLLKQFGAVPSIVPAPAIYESLQRGVVDAVASVWTAGMGDYKMHEVTKYAIPSLSLGTNFFYFIANKDAWDALPEEFKDYSLEFYHNAPYLWAREYKKKDAKYLPMFKKRLEFIDFPASEKAKLIAKAEEVYQRWAEDKEKKGLPGREVLSYYLKKRKGLVDY